MNRIKKLFLEPKEKLIPFLTAGYPNIDSTLEMVSTAIDAGADMIEIGIPFSDPQADGPVIQKSSNQALNNGITLKTIFNQVEQIRDISEVPIALMGYYNPILKMGHDKFLEACANSGVDGIILPDLPLEEAAPLCVSARAKNISPILLVAPNTSNDRIKKISEMAGDLIYAVSILGVTGNNITSKIDLKRYLKRVRENSSTPFIVGFGISSRKDVCWFNQYSDGAVVGSAIINKINKTTDPIKIIKNLIKELKGTK